MALVFAEVASRLYRGGRLLSSVFLLLMLAVAVLCVELLYKPQTQRLVALDPEGAAADAFGAGLAELAKTQAALLALCAVGLVTVVLSDQGGRRRKTE